MASVTLRGLTTEAVQNVSLDVREAEFLVLLGPRGSGKTGLLRCIAGLDRPAAGDILIGEHVVTHAPPGRRGVAMVVREYALYPHLTVRQNIAFPLEIRGASAAEITARVAETAALLRVAELLERHPAQLSLDERQRVALARAAVRRPHVFLFDEPLSTIDAGLRTGPRAELLALHRALNATMIYATADQADALTMGQRIAVLDQGKVHQVGTPAEVYERPADVFVARLVGSPGMNVLAGRVRLERSGKTIEAGSLAVPIELATYEGELQLGIRPEHVGLCAPNQGVGHADVLVVESHGNETLVHMNAGGQSLVARVPGFVDARVGTMVGIKIDRRRVHLFDAAGIPFA